MHTSMAESIFFFFFYIQHQAQNFTSKWLLKVSYLNDVCKNPSEPSEILRVDVWIIRIDVFLFSTQFPTIEH